MESLTKLENQSEDNQANQGNSEMAYLEAQMESESLLTIFPKETWMPIFENIFHPEDLYHLKLSSGFFGVLLEAHKTKILFPEVIKILCDRLANSPGSKYGTNGKFTKNVLNCRLVCRTWQIGVDIALQSSSTSSKLFDAACYPGIYLSGSSSDAHFSSPQQPAVFLQQFGGKYATKNRNPFIGRSLYISYNRLFTEYDSFTQQILQILASYGHHIWNFSLRLESSSEQRFDPSNVLFYERLRDFLQLMPNLKELKLKFGGRGSNDEWKALGLSLKSCVFPELKDLVYLQLQNMATPVFDTLLRRYSHVKILSSYTIESRIGRSDMLMYTLNLPNLTQIALTLRDINTLIQLGTSNALWPLKTLIIHLEYIMELDWQSLFQFLENRWTAALKELKIDYSHARFEDPTPVFPPLKLPNLKKFAFSSNTFVSLDFILPMTNSLERLMVRYTPRVGFADLEPDENGKEIQFLRFRGNLERSNIWSLFPNLNTAEYYRDQNRKQLCRRPFWKQVKQ